ncbi:MAG: hypothetical protein JRN52_06560 [Nitrososphaerota archaeon]|nr:hypothetical protein [Nitrososphaerota archaeon]
MNDVQTESKSVTTNVLEAQTIGLHQETVEANRLVEKTKSQIETPARSEEKIRLVLESKEHPVRITEYTTTSVSFSGTVYGQTTKRLVITGKTLDERQKKLVDMTYSLAEMLGVEVEIMDLGNEGVAKRILRKISGDTPKAPSLTFPQEIWNQFDLGLLLFDIIAKKKPLEPENLIELVSNQLTYACERERNTLIEEGARKELFLAA